tara:strand:+ start:638 stop:976 length:339 start_codon:yes stop_codon:yes gene_type:complete
MGCCGSRKKNSYKTKCDDILIEKKIELKKEIRENIGFGVLYSVACGATCIIAGAGGQPELVPGAVITGSSGIYYFNKVRELNDDIKDLEFELNKRKDAEVKIINIGNKVFSI